MQGDALMARRVLAGVFAFVGVVALPGLVPWVIVSIGGEAFDALGVGALLVLWGLRLLPFYFRRARRAEALVPDEPRLWLETLLLNLLMGTVGLWAFILSFKLLSRGEARELSVGAAIWFVILCAQAATGLHLARRAARVTPAPTEPTAHE